MRLVAVRQILNQSLGIKPARTPPCCTHPNTRTPFGCCLVALRPTEARTPQESPPRGEVTPTKLETFLDVAQREAKTRWQNWLGPSICGHNYTSHNQPAGPNNSKKKEEPCRMSWRNKAIHNRQPKSSKELPWWIDKMASNKHYRLG